MITRKYASDLKAGDVILDKRTDEEVEIEDFEPRPQDRILVKAFIVANGEPWDRTLDADSIVRVVES